jgi:hypothetical protein
MATRQKKTKVDPEQYDVFIRIVRVKVPESLHAAYQLERITVSGDKVTSRVLTGQPDTRVMTLSKGSEKLDPESDLL